MLWGLGHYCNVENVLKHDDGDGLKVNKFTKKNIEL